MCTRRAEGLCFPEGTGRPAGTKRPCRAHVQGAARRVTARRGPAGRSAGRRDRGQIAASPSRFSGSDAVSWATMQVSWSRSGPRRGSRSRRPTGLCGAPMNNILRVLAKAPDERRTQLFCTDDSAPPGLGSAGDHAVRPWSCLRWSSTAQQEPRAEANLALFEYIDGFRNSRRTQERLSFLRLIEFEEKYYFEEKHYSDRATAQQSNLITRQFTLSYRSKEEADPGARRGRTTSHGTFRQLLHAPAQAWTPDVMRPSTDGERKWHQWECSMAPYARLCTPPSPEEENSERAHRVEAALEKRALKIGITELSG